MLFSTLSRPKGLEQKIKLMEEPTTEEPIMLTKKTKENLKLKTTEGPTMEEPTMLLSKVKANLRPKTMEGLTMPI